VANPGQLSAAFNSLVQKGNGDIRVKLAQLEIRCVKDMAIVVVVGIRRAARKAHAKAVQRRVDPRAASEMPAIVADGGIPGRRRRGMRINAIAVVQNAPE
jgi:hypothetical protein